MTKCDPILLAPAVLGNPITAWTRNDKEIVACYASGLILSFPSNRDFNRSGRRLSVDSRGIRKHAIQLQNHDDEMIRAVRIDEHENIIAIVGDLGLRVFSSDQCHLNDDISKFDQVHQPFICINTFVLTSESEAIIVKSGGYDALIVNLSTQMQERCPIALPRQSVPIYFDSERFIWITESLDASTNKLESHLTISRYRVGERFQRFQLVDRTINTPIDILDRYVAYVMGKSKENVSLIKIGYEGEGRTSVSSNQIWCCRAHKHPIVALKLYSSQELGIVLVTVSEASSIKLWKDARCLQVLRLSPTIAFSLGYPYTVNFNGKVVHFVADEGLFEIAVQVSPEFKL